MSPPIPVARLPAPKQTAGFVTICDDGQRSRTAAMHVLAAARVIVRGMPERMFCHVAQTPYADSRSLARYPVAHT